MAKKVHPNINVSQLARQQMANLSEQNIARDLTAHYKSFNEAQEGVEELKEERD